MNIALVGGPATGKSTVAKKLQEQVPELFYAYMSKYAILIPMTLEATTHPQLLSYPRDEYVRTIVENKDLPTAEYKRLEQNSFARKLFQTHDPTVLGEIVLAVAPKDRPALFDNVGTEANAAYLRQRGVYIVGFHCSFPTQVKRRLENPRDIDPKNRKALEQQILETNDLLETHRTLQIADRVYFTDRISPDEIVKGLLHVLKK